jgi:hypothetical protein
MRTETAPQWRKYGRRRNCLGVIRAGRREFDQADCGRRGIVV